VIDPMDQLTSQQEASLEEGIEAAIDAALKSFDETLVIAILLNADADGVDDHERSQLAMALDTDEPDLGPLGAALGASAMLAGLASFFAAVVALAAAQARHVANPNDADAVTARENAIRSFRATYLHESTTALRETAERMLLSNSNAMSRAGQIKRAIGLSSAQAKSLHAVREVLLRHVNDPYRDAERMLAPARGYITAAQRQMLTKWIKARVSYHEVDELLDRHATALRDARTKAVAGNTAHQIAEAAKITGWQIAQRFGALPVDQRRYWQTAGDERVRIAHAQVPGMNLTGVPLNQPFATPLGPCFLPPLEHGCRCKATLRRAA
jgi:hypothetical protein